MEVYAISRNSMLLNASLVRPCCTKPQFVMQIEDDPTGGKFAGASGLLNGAPNKLEDIINFYVGDMVTALQRSAMQPGKPEIFSLGILSDKNGLKNIWKSSLLALRPMTFSSLMTYITWVGIHFKLEIWDCVIDLWVRMMKCIETRVS